MIALVDACIIGAASVGLSTAYAADVLSYKHSLHRGVGDAPQFYAVYLGLIALAAAIVLIPGSPLGLLTKAVQVLAGVLLPSAIVFLLLLSNDKAVLGPWANTNRVNVFTALVIAVLVMLSVILTASVLFPSFGTTQILRTLGIGAACALGIALWTSLAHPERASTIGYDPAAKASWRMPALETLPRAALTPNEPPLARYSSRVPDRSSRACRLPRFPNRQSPRFDLTSNRGWLRI